MFPVNSLGSQWVSEEALYPLKKIAIWGHLRFQFYFDNGPIKMAYCKKKLGRQPID
jgi:hypothetical protein